MYVTPSILSCINVYFPGPTFSAPTMRRDMVVYRITLAVYQRGTSGTSVLQNVFCQQRGPESIAVASGVIGVVDETADLDRYVVCVPDVHFLPTAVDHTYPFLISEELKNYCTASCTPQVAGDQLVILHHSSSHARARHVLSSPKLGIVGVPSRQPLSSYTIHL
jgi:hypothetical protein